MNNMKKLASLALVLLALAGCAARSRRGVVEPTMTAIPLPTHTATRAGAQTEAAPSTPRPSTPAPTPTLASMPRSTATATPRPTATSTTPPPSPTPEPATAITARPQAARPRPTARPEFTGKLLFQTTLGGEFYVVNLAAGPSATPRRIADGVDPAWSPDGQRIAFTRWREPRGVYVIEADGMGERRVFDWDQARWPSWSPDGDAVLFSRQHGGQSEETERCVWGFCFEVPAKPHWRLGVVQTADGGFSEPPDNLVCLAPDWSPNGQQVVYGGEQGVVVQTLDGKRSRQLTDDARDTTPAWSPDRQEIVFTRRQHDHWEIYVVDASGGNLRRLTDTPDRPDGQPGSSAAAAWSPDGRHLAFLTDRAGKWQIWVMAADGGQPRPLVDTEAVGLALEYASLGERVLSWTQ